MARVVGCADGATSRFDDCPDARFHLESIETLKALNSGRDLSGAYQGGDFSHCGQHFEFDKRYLIFVREGGRIHVSAGGPLQARTPATRTVHRTLDILRRFRDGESTDLSDPWMFSDTGVACELRQVVANRWLTFRYAYEEQPDGVGYNIVYDESGEALVINELPVPDLSQRTLDFSISVEGPPVVSDGLFFMVQLLPHERALTDGGSVSVGNDGWSLQTQSVKIFRDGVSFAEFFSNQARGDQAQQIFDAMLTPADVVVTLSVSSESEDDTTAPPLRVETTSVQFAADVARFRACVNGTRRIPRAAAR